MKKTMKRLLSAVMAMAMMTALLLPISASEAEPYVGDRFRYYTEKGPSVYAGSFVVTELDSQTYMLIEDGIFGIMGEKIPGGYITGEVVSRVKNIIRQNNWDNTGVGTYTIKSMDIVHYKEHLLTGQVYVELRQVEFEISFKGSNSSENDGSHSITVTIDH